MGIEEEAIDQIIEAHTDTVDGLKDRLTKAQADASALSELQKELETAKAGLEAVQKDGWKDKHDALKKEFEEYRSAVTAKEAKAAKEAAVRAYYKGRGITGRALEVAMRGSSAEIEAIALAEDGKIKDASALDALVAGTFSGLVSTTATMGAGTATPPAGGSTGGPDGPNSRAAQLYAAYHANLYGETKKE